MEKSKPKWKKFLKLSGNLLCILSFLYLGKTIYTLGFDVTWICNIPLFVICGVIGLILKVATVFLMGHAWCMWLACLSFTSSEKNPETGMGKINEKEALGAYVKANMGKYLPGNVMHYVERNLFASNLGISQKKMLLSTVFEVLGLVGVAFLVSVATLGERLQELAEEIFHYTNQHVFTVLMIIGALLLIGIFLFFSIRYLLETEPKGRKKFLFTLGSTFLIYFAVLLMLGIILVLLYATTGKSMTISTAVILTAAYILAWVSGFVIPGAPGGIGIREMVLTLLLGPVIGKPLILTLMVMHRLITIIGDFIAYFLRLWVCKTDQGQR